jgi:hypothetical protein
MNFKSFDLLYSCISKNGIEFKLYAGSNQRNYENLVDRDKDKIFYIQIDNGNLYPYTTIDGTKMLKEIIANKQIPKAKYNEYWKIIKELKQALNGYPNSKQLSIIDWKTK